MVHDLHHLSALVVRWLHVLGLAVLLGGGVLAWAVARRDARAALPVAVAYEWLFWAGAGLLVMTGVGNLGALAPGVPGPGTRWGAVFAAKLAVVLAFVGLSVVRSLAVARWRADASSTGTAPAGVNPAGTDAADTTPARANAAEGSPDGPDAADAVRGDTASDRRPGTGGGGAAAGDGTPVTFGTAYGATVVALLVLLALGEVLAHG